MTYPTACPPLHRRNTQHRSTMFRLLVILWFFVPCTILLWHFGPGKALMMEDRAGRQIRLANEYEGDQDWRAAATAYATAQEQLPDHSTDLHRRLKIAEAVALNKSGQLDAGRELLHEVVKEMEDDPQADVFELSRIQHELATVSYYGAWRMRLEGRPAEDWRPIADLACDQLRSLAHEAQRQATSETGRRSTDAQRQLRVFRRNLEAAVKLQYMHLTDFEKKVLPDTYAIKTDPREDQATPVRSGAEERPPTDENPVDENPVDEKPVDEKEKKEQK